MKIRRVVYKSGKAAWQLDYGLVTQPDGSRKRRQVYFPTRDEAAGALAAEKGKRQRHGDSAVSLSEDLRVRYSAADAALSAAGGTIEQAVALFLKQAKAKVEPVTLGELFARCLAAKKKLGKSERYLQQFSVSCLSFVRGRESQLSHTVTRGDVRAWVSGNGWKWKTQKGYLGDLRALFNWGISECGLPMNPATAGDGERIELAAKVETEIELLTVKQVRRLLIVASARPQADRPRREDFRELLWYLVLGVFCGVRPAELRRMAADAVCLEDGHAIVRGKTAKTRLRRVVDLAENAREWLRLVGVPRTICPANFVRRWGRLRAAAGLGKWPHDAMRHTFASMHYAHHQNESLLKAQMGHSDDEDVLFQHYRGLVSRRAAAAFWELRPGRLIADCK